MTGAVAIDIEHLETVGGTRAGEYRLVEPGILLAVPRQGYRQSVDGARASLEEQVRLSKRYGRPLVVLVLVDRVQDQDSRSRRVWRDEPKPEYTLGLGLVGIAPLTRAIGSFFIGLSRPRIPTGLFSSLEEGVAWARGLQEEKHGD